MNAPHSPREAFETESRRRPAPRRQSAPTERPARARRPAQGRSTDGMYDYDANSSQQLSTVRKAAELLGRLVETIGPVEPEFRMVDYGCGPGTSAVETVRPVVEAYRRLSPHGRLAVCHADQPGNDWNGLFALASGPRGYGAGDPALRREAAVGSFYRPMVAAGSVTLGTCFTASHWFSRAVSVDSPGTVSVYDLTGPARAQVAAQAEADWTTFLRRRSEELEPGGRLLVSGLATPSDARDLQEVVEKGNGYLAAVQTVAESMAAEGLLDRALLDRFVFPSWFRTAEELRQPLEQVPALRRALEIESLTVVPATEKREDTFAAHLNDPARYAALVAGLVRGFADSTLRSQLFGPSAANAAAAGRLAEEFFGRLTGLIEAAPERYTAIYWISTLVLRRR